MEILKTQSDITTKNTSSPRKYEKYKIETKFAKNIVKHPHIFRVKVNKFQLIKMVIKEIFKYGFDFSVALSRPCVYGVFSRPIGGLAPIEEKCVGCLRCTLQYPKVVTIEINKEWLDQGDEILSAQDKSTILYEASTGRVPVKGAGYPGPFSEKGWDSIWTDMSEIVRPTRDGIYGREYISTKVDLGIFPENIKKGGPKFISIDVPVIFNCPPQSNRQIEVLMALARTALEINTLYVLPVDYLELMLNKKPETLKKSILLANNLNELDKEKIKDIPVIFFTNIESAKKAIPIFYDKIIGVFGPISQYREIIDFTYPEIKVYWFNAPPNGYIDNKFVKDYIMEIHLNLVNKSYRNRSTILVSGGINKAEHLPKSILCGCNGVILSIPLWVALQAKYKVKIDKECEIYDVKFPKFSEDWAVQRLKNLINSWRDQLLEVSGAMGIRDIRRMVGEHGRLIIKELIEQEILHEIEKSTELSKCYFESK